MKVFFADGQEVTQGQSLFQLDARPFQATLSHAEAAEQQAVAALSQAEATLEQSKADVAKQEALWVTAKANYDRFKELVGRGAVSQKDVDDATGAERATYAAVAAAKANVIAAQAAIGVQRAAIAAARAAAEKEPWSAMATSVVSWRRSIKKNDIEYLR